MIKERNILITNFEIRQYSGSEINVICLAKRFKELGFQVYILALNFSKPLFNEIENEGYNIINIIEDNFDFSKIYFELVWSQHSFILDWLIFNTNLKAKKVIVSSLSPFEPFETVSDFANYMNIILANSYETKEKLLSEGANKVVLFENSAPEDFFFNYKITHVLDRIAIVSNHVPNEIIRVKESLEKLGKTVEIYGLGGKRELVNKEILNMYDLIITIGKTVQYCFALKIPVYVYDRFGGCGYISRDNIQLNRKYNFSGRGFNVRDEAYITQDILNGFEKSLLNLDYLHEYAFKDFCFEKNLDNILSIVLNDDKIVDFDKIREANYNLKRKKKIYESLYNFSFSSGYDKGKDYYKPELDMYIKDNLILKKELNNVIYINNECNKRISELEDKLNEIYNSKMWKIMQKFKKIKLK